MNIDIMIEDYYDYAIKLADKGIKVLYFRREVLKQINHPNVKEVRNWGDVFIEMKKYSK